MPGSARMAHLSTTIRPRRISTQIVTQPHRCQLASIRASHRHGAGSVPNRSCGGTDHRIHWMLSTLPAAVAADPRGHTGSAPGRSGLSYGATQLTVSGTLDWAPGPNPWPWSRTVRARSAQVSPWCRCSAPAPVSRRRDVGRRRCRDRARRRRDAGRGWALTAATGRAVRRGRVPDLAVRLARRRAAVATPHPRAVDRRRRRVS